MSTPSTGPVIDGLQISNWTRPVLQELHDSKVDVVNATCAVWENAAETMRSVAQWLERVRVHEDLVALATSVSDLDRIRQSGRVAVLLGFQNTSPFEDDYRYVELFHRVGVRIAQLTYNHQNLVGTGCFEERDSGLTRYGRVIVAEMNRLGMLIDLSHVGDTTCREAIDASSRPVAVTHSNPRWFHGTSRNKPDDVIARLVARGGMIGLCLYPTVSGGEATSLRAFSEMALKMVETHGPEHIGLGSDCTRGWDDSFVDWLRNGRWNPPFGREKPRFPAWPSWFSGPADFPRLAEGLYDVGLDDATVAGIMGANWRRFFAEAITPEGGSTHA